MRMELHFPGKGSEFVKDIQAPSTGNIISVSITTPDGVELMMYIGMSMFDIVPYGLPEGCKAVYMVHPTDEMIHYIVIEKEGEVNDQ